MYQISLKPAAWLAIGLSLLLTSCGGSGGTTTPPPVTTYTLSIGSTNPASGVSVSVGPADNNGTSGGTTPLTLTYNANTTVVISAPATAGGNKFSSWTGCQGTTSSCTTVVGNNTTITANYSLTSVAVSPNPASVTIGSSIEFSATVNGSVTQAVTWTVAAPSGSSLSPGTISTAGAYVTPYPAPPTVTVTATSTADPTQSGSATVTITAPAVAAGPALSVDAGNQTRSISPLIYGMNGYMLGNSTADAAAAATANISVSRWGGDSTERYNYQLDVTNAIDDWYFQNMTGVGGDAWIAVNGVSAFDAFVQSNAANGIKTLGTVPVQGWVSKDSTSCSFPSSVYPDQLAVNNKAAFSNGSSGCGSGIYPNGVGGCTSESGCNIPADPTVTSVAAPPPAPPAASAVNAAWANATWSGGWANYLVNKFGPGNPAAGTGKGVSIYDLDNEPTWWDSNDADIHPLPFTYDEVTNGGIGTALAIKTADPTAEVSGPVIDFWWGYFYSMKDVRSGWNTGAPCYLPWSNPVDRKAHNGIPFIEYYLQQFKAAETTYGARLLDYLDLHTYDAASYNGNGVGLTTAGDTGEQQARLNSTRAFWDPTYIDPNFPQPNYITDANYTSSCSTPPQSPQLIPMMQGWVARDYPGTKTSIDEYNWGGLEQINGALAQADILGIFGEYGLDMAHFWPYTNPAKQIPAMMSFAIYRNYDGNKSTFGDTALLSTSANQGQLSVYGAVRSSDKAVTVIVINKTYGDLTSSLSLANLAAGSTTAQPYLYSNANLAAIVAQTAVAVTPPAAGGKTSTISSYTFPAQSITLFVVPQ